MTEGIIRLGAGRPDLPDTNVPLVKVTMLLLELVDIELG